MASVNAAHRAEAEHQLKIAASKASMQAKHNITFMQDAQRLAEKVRPPALTIRQACR